ncbi:hypothetical protein BDD12DRAFT_908776 [Trichophaea hybrida]|nr:hypothetical protein BDD12DRAFT_908776 [Trichophaea hybrida]
MTSSNSTTKGLAGPAGNSTQASLPPISIPNTLKDDSDQSVSADSPEKVSVSPLDAEPPLPPPMAQPSASPRSDGTWGSASSEAATIGSSIGSSSGGVTGRGGKRLQQPPVHQSSASPGSDGSWESASEVSGTEAVTKGSSGSDTTGRGKPLPPVHLFNRRLSKLPSPSSSGVPSGVSTPGDIFAFSPHNTSTVDLSDLSTVDPLATPPSNKGAFTPLSTPSIATPLTTPPTIIPPMTTPPTAATTQPPPTLAYPVVAYHLPALDEPNNGIQRVTLQVTIAPKIWSIALSPPFPSSKHEHTIHTIQGGTLSVIPHPLCSCGQAHQEQKRHEDQLKENKKPRSRSGSATMDGSTAQGGPDKDWDPLWACTAACRIRRSGGKGYNPWRSRAPDGEIGVEFWVYVKPDSSEINNDEDEDVPLLSRRNFTIIDPRTAPPLWKRELLIVRIEDRLPVDVNPEDIPGREPGEEIRALESWLKNRCRIAGGEWGWADRFTFRLSDKSEGKRKAL